MLHLRLSPVICRCRGSYTATFRQHPFVYTTFRHPYSISSNNNSDSSTSTGITGSVVTAQPNNANSSRIAKEKGGKWNFNQRFPDFSRLLSRARPERKPLIIAGGLMAISSTISISIPFFIGRVIDVFTTTTPPPLLLVIVPLIFGISSTANATRLYLLRRSSERIVKRLRDEGYAQVLAADLARRDLMSAQLSKSPSSNNENTEVKENRERPKEVITPKEQDFADVTGTGDVLSRLSADATWLAGLVSKDLLEGVRSTVMAIAGIGLMFYISPQMTGLMLALVPPMAIASTYYGRYLKKLSQRVQAGIGAMGSVAGESLRGQTTVHAFNATSHELRRFGETTQNIQDLGTKEGLANGIFYGATGFVGVCTLFALLIYGGSLVAGGAITIGELSSLLLYTFYVGSSLSAVAGYFSSLMKGLGAARRVFSLLDVRPVSVHLHPSSYALPPATPILPPLPPALVNSPTTVQLKNVTFAYPTRPHANILNEFNLDLSPEKGRLTAIAGRSGSGKSSVAALLMRFYDPQQGDVIFDGENIKSLQVEQWREIVSIVPQEIKLFTVSIKDNITFGRPEATMHDILQAADIAACHFIEYLVDGYDANATQLSGGEKQRLAIARAVLRKPKILIMDEATSALDTQSEASINRSIRRIADEYDTLVVVIAHRLTTLQRCDRVIFVDEGKVVEDGTYEELMQEGRKFRQFVREGGKNL